MTEQIDDLAKRPGAEGAMWRLVRHWNPTGVSAWLAAEALAGTRETQLAAAMGNVMAGAAWGYANEMSDVRQALLGPHGVVPYFQHSLQAKVDRHRLRQSPGGIFLPDTDGVLS